MERVKPEIQKSVNDKLRDFIEQAGNVTAFAQSISVTRDTVNNWLIGRSDIRVNDLVKISEKYKVSTDWLLGLTDHPTTNEDMKTAITITGLSEQTIQRISELKPGENVSRAFGFNSELDTFLYKYSFDIAFHLSQINRAVQKGITALEIVRNTEITSENWEQLFDILNADYREIALQIFEYSEFFRRAQEDLFSTDLILDKIRELQLSIHRPKETNAGIKNENLQESKANERCVDNGEH